MTENLPAVRNQAQIYGIKDFEYVREQLQSNVPAVYEMAKPSFEFDNASKYHRAGFYLNISGGAVITALSAIGNIFLSGGMLLAGIGFSAVTCGATAYNLLAYKFLYKNHYSVEILEKLNIRPSLVNVNYSGDMTFVDFYLDIDDKIKIISDLEELRDQENEGLPVITGGKLLSESDDSYIFEKDGKESTFSLANSSYRKPGQTQPSIVSKHHNISRRITPCTQNELKAYLNARMKSGDRMLIGGRVTNGSLQADLFRDEQNKGAFDIYLKAV